MYQSDRDRRSVHDDELGRNIRFPFQGRIGLIDALMEYLQLTTPSGSFRPLTINVCCQSKDYGRAIIQRVESYTASLLQCMCSSDGDIDRQFVVQVGRRFYRAYTENSKPRYEIHRSLTTLLKALARPRVTFSELKFDDATAKRQISFIRRVR